MAAVPRIFRPEHIWPEQRLDSASAPDCTPRHRKEDHAHIEECFGWLKMVRSCEKFAIAECAGWTGSSPARAFRGQITEPMTVLLIVSRMSSRTIPDCGLGVAFWNLLG
jgi:hypothetical protein